MVTATTPAPAPVNASPPAPPAESGATCASKAYQVAVPVRHVLVRDPRGHVKHDDSALPLDAAGGSGTEQPVSCVSRGCNPPVPWFEVGRSH